MDTLKRNNVHIQDGPGPVLLYAHGFGCNQAMWKQITPAFARTHRQILFDYVGSGASDLASFDSDRYSKLDGYAQDVLDVCHALGLDRGVTLVAHSVSCSIGILAAVAKPELFERIVMIGPSPCFLNDPPNYFGGFDRSDLEGLIDLMQRNYIGWANQLAPVVAGGSGGMRVSAELVNSFCSTDHHVMETFARAAFFADNRADLENVPCPCLILQHRHDMLAPLSVGEYVQAHLPDGEMKVLDVAGHAAHMSDPDLVIEAMNEFIVK